MPSTVSGEKMSEKVFDIIRSGKILVSDGAWGTMLQASGLKNGECPESWNLLYPEKVGTIARSYYEAGADIIETNSFGGSSVKLRHYGLQDKTIEINKRAAEISKEYAGKETLIFGSVGPTGKFLITGDIEESEMFDAFAAQATGLAQGGVDLILLETFYDTMEAQIAVNAIKSVCDTEIICSFTYDSKPDGSFKTMMGNSIEDTLGFMRTNSLRIAAANCGNGFRQYRDFAEVFHEFSKEIPLMIQANAGLPLIKEGKLFYPETPDFIEEILMEFIKHGVKIIGGCCGTTPAHIRKIKQKVIEYQGH